MKNNSTFVFLKKGWKEINSNVNHMVIKNFKMDQLYILDYNDIKEQYKTNLLGYTKYPELVDIDEFSINYSFSYHQINEMLDNVESKEAMYREVKKYLKNLDLVESL